MIIHFDKMRFLYKDIFYHKSVFKQDEVIVTEKILMYYNLRK